MRKLLLALLLASAPLLADGSTTALCTAKSTTGPTQQIYSATTGTGGENWSFLKSGDGSARLEMSLDAGTSYVPLKPFTPGQGGNLITVPACGGCRFRGFITSADAARTVTVGVCVSGVLVPTTAP